MSFKSGFVAIAGAPNVGKSTLLNRILGEKVSITSDKPQTTRNRVQGVLHLENAQMVFLDTPGIHPAKNPLNRYMVDVASATLTDADVVLWVVDASKPNPESEEMVLSRVKSRTKPVVLALNKIDLVEKEILLPMLDTWNKVMDFTALVPVSARTGSQVEKLVKCMAELLPEGPPYFPEDALTDMTERFLAAELVREKVFRLTGQEIPYTCAVTVENFLESEDDGMVRIHAVIHVEKDSQKGIIIGKAGAMLKKIGTLARKDLERMMGVKIYLELFVRVEKNWTTDPKALRRLGYQPV
ncbi:MAG: GTPase Era [Deltaproteobacteria bacterium]|nr:GTPase Era [Deltaproteobacteria bacterium]